MGKSGEDCNGAVGGMYVAAVIAVHRTLHHGGEVKYNDPKPPFIVF